MEEYIERKPTIKFWAENDRPREKLIRNGRSALSDAELIAIIIGSGHPSESAIDLSRRILSEVDNNLYELGRLSVNDLMKFRGIGEAKAVSIVSALELGRRRKESNLPDKVYIRSSKDTAELFMPLIADLDYEQFWVLMLDRSNKVLEKKLISSGGVAGTVVDLRLIFKTAIENLASSIILCHNHPSGNKKPSREDITLTRKIRETGGLMDIEVLDHIIVAGNDYLSFVDSGII